MLLSSLHSSLEGSHILLGGLAVGGAVLHGVQPLLAGLLQSGHCPILGNQLPGQIRQTAAGGLLAQIHAQAVLSVILEQGVGPSGTVAVLIGAVGRGCGRTAPDGGAAGGVGDVHPVTEQLGNQAGIAGLGAAGAGAGELQHGCP